MSNYTFHTKPAFTATRVCSCADGILWFYGFDHPGGAWEVVRFEPSGNRSMGQFESADAAIGSYRRDVSGEPVGVAATCALNEAARLPAIIIA